MEGVFPLVYSVLSLVLVGMCEMQAGWFLFRLFVFGVGRLEAGRWRSRGALSESNGILSDASKTIHSPRPPTRDLWSGSSNSFFLVHCTLQVLFPSTLRKTELQSGERRVT